MGNAEQTTMTKSGPAWLAGAVGPVLRWAIIPVAAVGALPVIGLATNGGGAAVMAALADPLSVLAARSPGARPAGALTQTKRNKVSLPEEHVLADVLTKPLDRFAAPGAGDMTPGAVTDEPDPGAAAAFAVDETAPGDDAAPGPVAAGFFPSQGLIITPTIGSSAGGGSGSSGGGATSVTPVAPVTAVASVPEPGTWLTLFVGFGAVGGALRSRRRRVTLGDLGAGVVVHVRT